MQDRTLFDLTGRKALVTGGTQGIGRAGALALAKAGADVAITGRHEDTGAETMDEIRALGRQSIFVRCDVADPEQVAAMMRTVVKRFGRLDIAVNSAGAYAAGDDSNQSKDAWDRVIGVNLTGTWLCAQAQMQQMIKQTPVEGKIINIASIAGTVACSNGSYDASKAAVVHLTRSLAAQWGRFNINVNSISPGYLAAVLGKSRTPEDCERLRQFVPLGYVQRPEDLHGPIVFLASKASDYMTGQDLVVDGGHTLGAWISPLNRDIPPRVTASSARSAETADRSTGTDADETSSHLSRRDRPSESRTAGCAGPPHPWWLHSF